MLRLMVSALVEWGEYEVLEACNGQEALAILTSPEGQNIAGVISDWQMPLMTGLELMQEITKRKLNVPVLLVSGAAVEDIRTVVGSRSFLAKPFSTPKLLAAVAAAFLL